MSSKRALRRRSCESKARFTNGAEAQRSSQKASARSQSLILAYRCRFCRGWHIGHPPYKIRQAYLSKGKE